MSTTKTTRWPGMKPLSAMYEEIVEGFDADAWIIGRVSMQAYVDEQERPPVWLRYAFMKR